MARFAPIANHPELVRDLNSGAISSLNKSAVNKYQKQKKLVEENKAQVEEINNLKNEVAEIKDLMIKLLEKMS